MEDEPGILTSRRVRTAFLLQAFVGSAISSAFLQEDPNFINLKVSRKDMSLRISQGFAGEDAVASFSLLPTKPIDTRRAACRVVVSAGILVPVDVQRVLDSLEKRLLTSGPSNHELCALSRSHPVSFRCLDFSVFIDLRSALLPRQARVCALYSSSPNLMSSFQCSCRFLLLRGGSLSVLVACRSCALKMLSGAR